MIKKIRIERLENLRRRFQSDAYFGRFLVEREKEVCIRKFLKEKGILLIKKKDIKT